MKYDEAELAARVARAKEEIMRDITAEVVPADVPSFAALHDYVDANGYGGAFEEDFDPSDEAAEFWNRVQDRLDLWLSQS